MTNALFTVLNILGLRQNFLQHLSEADIATLMLVSKQCRELLTEEILSLPGWKHQNNFKIVPAPHGQFFLFKSGLLYAQGTNVDGHLGLEGIRSFDMPTLVNLPADERVIDVQHVYTSNSVYHNTSRTFILTKKGHVYSCGSKGSELGYSLEKMCLP
ncbi:MAG: hypothetical protein HWD59_03395 [Coxiellaceae bacterium]|nr:MAG: hypothetical protein HWD59_03395 [Coxiellaceae bacterium]